MSALFARIRNLGKATQLTVVVVVVAAVAVGVVITRNGGSSTSDTLVARGAADELLKADDVEGSPHLALGSMFDPETNKEATVPKSLETDSDKELEVESAKFEKTDGPYNLVWKLKNGEEKIDCINCAMLDVRLKKIIKSLLASDAAGDLDSIVGYDPARTVAGDYAGNGWQVEFVVGRTAKGQQAGQKISEWAMKNAKEQKIFSVSWQNLLVSEGACDKDLEGVRPTEIFASSIGTSAQALRDAAMDRVVIASPAYAPQFEDRDGAQFVSGWKATSC